jgi:hypothetical protein
MAVLLLSCIFTPTVSSAENVFRQTNDNNSTKEPVLPTSEITKDFAPFVFDMKLDVTNSVDFNDFLAQLNNIIEFYLFDRLFDFGLDMEHVTIRAVTLQVTLLVRRRQTQQQQQHLRSLQQNTKEITVEVDGASHYEVDIAQLDLNEVKGQILQEVDTLLTLDNVGQFIMDSNVDNVVQIKSVSTNDVTQDDDQQGNDDTTENQTNAPEEDKLEKPSTLAMVFGFVLLFITILSLFGYVFIFQQKRQKRLMRKQRLKHKLPPNRRKTSPNQQLFPHTPQQKPLTSMNIMPASPSRPEDSSFKETNSITAVEDNKVVDSFAEELEAASARDEHSWATLRQKQSSFDGNFVDMNGGKKTNEPGTFTPYSPYGDGAKASGDVGGLDDVSNWEPYGPAKAEEKKDDAWGTASAFSMASIPASAFSQEGFEMNLSQIGDDNTERASIASSEASSMMLEVQKLSKYVQRYEKRKERKVQREKERTDKSEDGASDLGSDYLQKLKSSLNQRSRNKVTPGAYPSFEESSNARTNTTLKQAGANLTSQLLGKSKTPPASQRLTRPQFKDEFKVETVEEEEEKPRPRNIFPDDENSQPARRRAKSDGDRPQYNFNKPKTNLTSLRGYQAVMENRKKLAALRSNTAIIDTSKSDVNIGGFNPSPGDDKPEPSPRPPQSPTSKQMQTHEPTAVPVRRWTPSPKRLSTPEPTVTPERRWSSPKKNSNSNSKFSSALNMFEKKPQNAVFPPGQRLF